MGDRTYFSYQSVERRPVTVEVFGPIDIPLATPGVDIVHDLINYPAGSILADAWIDVKTAVVGAAAVVADLATDEATPTVFINDVDLEALAMTRLGTGVVERATVDSILGLSINHDGNVTTAGIVWIYVMILRKDY